MTRVAAKLGRLETPHASLGKGGSGAPDPNNTPEGILFLLGGAAMKSPSIRFGVELFCLIHWPSTAWTPTTADRPHGQRNPSQRLINAHLRLHAWLLIKVSRRWPKPSQQLAKRLAADPEFWMRLVREVLDEAMSGNLCRCCNGAGKVWSTLDAKGERTSPHEKTCTVCNGSAHVPRGTQNRAKRVRLRAETFKAEVEPAYKWLLNLVNDLANRADETINDQCD